MNTCTISKIDFERIFSRCKKEEQELIYQIENDLVEYYSCFAYNNLAKCYGYFADNLAWINIENYLNNDMEKFKNIYFVVSKLILLSDNNFNYNRNFIYSLLSDNPEIIKNYSLHEPTNHTPSHLLGEVDYPPYNIGKLKPETYDFRFATYALQCVLKKDWDEYHKIKELANKKFKKLPVGIGFEFEFYDLLENRDLDKIQNLIKTLLKPKLHKLFNDVSGGFYSLFSFHPTLFTKLCWMNGLEIEIDNPLVPMKLMPVEPLADYDLIYDFLKPDYDWDAARKRGKAIQRKEKILRFFGFKKVGGK